MVVALWCVRSRGCDSDFIVRGCLSWCVTARGGAREALDISHRLLRVCAIAIRPSSLAFPSDVAVATVITAMADAMTPSYQAMLKDDVGGCRTAMITWDIAQQLVSLVSKVTPWTYYWRKMRDAGPYTMVRSYREEGVVVLGCVGESARWSCSRGRACRV